MQKVCQSRRNPLCLSPTSGQNLCFQPFDLTSSCIFPPIGHLKKKISPNLIQNNPSLSSQMVPFSSYNIYFFSYTIRGKSTLILRRKRSLKCLNVRLVEKFFSPSQIGIQKKNIFISSFTSGVRAELPLLLKGKGFESDTNLYVRVSRINALVFTEVVGFPTREIRIGRSPLPREHLRKF